jgi:hypothetical protein
VEKKVFRPQAGPQELYFTKYWCNVVIYGGAVFAGKTYAITMDALRDCLFSMQKNVSGYQAQIFRRSYPQIMQSLWPTAREIYTPVRYNSSAEKPTPHFNFYNDPKRSRLIAQINFSHLMYEKDLEDYQGLQAPFIAFDELEHMSKRMFTYMFSRLRSQVKLPPEINTQRLRGSCNPLPGSWLADLLDQGGYIQDDGYPDLGMRGKVRYLYHLNDEWVFGDDPVSMQNKYKEVSPPFSFTFIAGTLDDNSLGLKANAGYQSGLRALSDWDYDVLVRGNWRKVRQGKLFLNEYFHVYEEDDITAKINITHKVITVDTAQGIGQANDNTVFLCSGRTPDGKIVLLDCLVGKFTPMQAYRIAEAFYIKHNRKVLTILNAKTGVVKTYQAAPLQGMAIEFANRGIDILMELKKKGYNVLPIKRQGKVPEGQRGNDKVSRAIAALPTIKNSGIWMPNIQTRHTGYDRWCDSDPEIQKVLEPGESVCTDPKLWTLSMKSELMGFAQGDDRKEVAGQHDDRVDVLVDAVNMLDPKNISWVNSMLSYGQ